MLSVMQDEPLGLHLVFDRAERLFGDRAVYCRATGAPRRFVYRDVFAAARRLAAYLDVLGVRPGDRVGTFAWNRAEHLVAYVAVPGSGRVMHTVNIRLGPDEVAYTVGHADDRVVLVDPSLWETWQKVPLPACVEHVVVLGDAAGLPERHGRAAVHVFDPLAGGDAPPLDWFRPDDERQAAGVCYTSGTTGGPKAIVYSHRSIYLHALTLGGADTFAIGHRDVVLPVVPMFHANSWNLPYASMLAGAGLALPGRDTAPAGLAACVEESGATFAAAVPTVWLALVAGVASGDVPRAALATLRALVIGGSAAARSLVEDIAALGIEPVHAWGMTESSPVGLIAGPPAPGDVTDAATARLSQGRPMPGLAMRLVADERDVAWDGETPGELEIGGPYVVASYYRPAGDDNATRFADSPDGRRWLRSGDVANITPDGYVRLVDRVKDLVKSGGEWISSIDLENHLLAHPGVQEAAVVAVPDPKWGERPVALAVPAGPDVDADDLRAFLAERLPKWQVPDRVVLTDALPKTSVGKLDKKRIRADLG